MQKKRSPGEASVEKSALSTAPSTDGGAKRRKIQLHSELSAALEEAVKEIGQLKTELTQVRAQNKQWLILQQEIGAQKKEIAVLQDEKKQLAARKIPIGHDVRHTKWKWDNTKPGKSNVAPSLCYFFLNHSAFFPQVLALHIGFHLDHGRR